MIKTAVLSLSLIALAVGLLVSCPCKCAAMDIVKAGKACAVIVIPDNPLPAVNYAAQELQYHIDRSTGVKLGIISESKKPAGGSFIYLGGCQMTQTAGIRQDQLPPNGCVVKSVDDSLFMIGNDSDGPVLGRLINNYTRVGTLPSRIIGNGSLLRIPNSSICYQTVPDGPIPTGSAAVLIWYRCAYPSLHYGSR